MGYVIIGNSAAAIGCVEGIRSVDKTGGITLLSRERFHTYSRPLISYLLEGKTDLERMKYRPDSFYQDMGVDARLGVAVTAIRPREHKVVCATGEEIPYDKLLVATGSAPFVPAIQGLEEVERKFTFLSLEDAQALEAALTPESRVFILGAGLIGLKCAEGIAKRVKSVDIADLAPQVLSSILDETAARRVQAHLERQGLRFHLGDTAVRFEQGRAFLKSGGTVDFDILVAAVGVRPNVALVQEAGGQVRKGIVTDDTDLTTLPDVYAAGDCCESADLTTGEHRVLALLPNAYLQGECAGKNMAGSPARFDQAVAMNAMGLFGLHLITAGSYRGEALVQEDGGDYKAFFVEDGLLKGYILVGDCLENAGVYTALIRERTPLSAVDFGLLRQHPRFAAFSRERRREMFG